MPREEIEQRFADAGWEIDDSFREHLLIGYSGANVSLLAHKEVWANNVFIFEILYHEERRNSWVTQIPTPQQAENFGRLLRKHGESPKA